MHIGKELVIGIDEETKELKYIDEVASGRECNCICPACMGKLIAKQGTIKMHHFAHERNQSCEYGLQTSLQLLAKCIIEEKGYFYLPDLKWNEYSFDSQFNILSKQSIQSFGSVKVNSISIEYNTSNYIPDLLIDSSHGKIILSIYITHRISEKAKEEIQDHQTTTLEIKVNDLKELITKDILESILYNKKEMNQRSNWIYCKPLAHIMKKSNEQYEELTIKQSILNSVSGLVKIKRYFQFERIDLYNILDHYFYRMENNTIIRSRYSQMNNIEKVEEIDTRVNQWIILSFVAKQEIVENPYFKKLYNAHTIPIQQLTSINSLLAKYGKDELLLYHFYQGYFLKLKDDHYYRCNQENGIYQLESKKYPLDQRKYILIKHTPTSQKANSVIKKKKEVVIQNKDQPLDTIMNLWKKGHYESMMVYDVIHHNGVSVNSQNIEKLDILVPYSNNQVWIVRKYIIWEE